MEFSHWPTLMFHVIPPISSDGLINLLNWYVNIGKKNRIQIDDVKLRQYETKWFKLSVVKFYTMGLAFKLSKTKTNLNWKQVFDWIVTFESLTKCNEKHRPSKVLFFMVLIHFKGGKLCLQSQKEIDHTRVKCSHRTEMIDRIMRVMSINVAAETINFISRVKAVIWEKRFNHLGEYAVNIKVWRK